MLENPSQKDFRCEVRNYVQSRSFTEDFGFLARETSLDLEWPFVKDYLNWKGFKRNVFSIRRHWGWKYTL